MPPDSRDDDRGIDLGRHDRRRFLRAVGAGAAALGVGAGTAAAGDEAVAADPVRRTYDPEPVSTESVATLGGDAVGGQGKGESEEVPRGEPSAGSADRSPGTAAQRDVAERDLVGTDYDGLGADDVRGVVPSDAQIGAGSEKHVEAVNSVWGVFDKASGDREFATTLDAWFANVSPFIDDENPGEEFFEAYIIFDPQVQYDRLADRYYLACVEYGLASGRGAFLLSVSDDGDPHGTWYNYRVPPLANEGLVDYPQLGHGTDGVYLTQNFFPEGFAGASMVVLDRRALGDGGATEAWHVDDLRNPDGSLAFTPQPAVATGGETFHLANSTYFYGDALTLWDVAYEPGSPPAVSNEAVDVPPYTNAPNAEQPGTKAKIDMGDSRLLNASRGPDGSVWTAHVVNDGSMRWYRLDPASGTAAQVGTYRRVGQPTFFPTVAAAPDGGAAFVYNYTHPDHDADPGYAGVEVAVRSPDAPDGAIEAYDVVKEGESPYDYVEGDRQKQVMRWGDYNGVSVDPDDGSVWVASQYAADLTDYTTRIGRVTLE